MREKLIEIASDLGVKDETTDIFPAQDYVDLTPQDWNEKKKGNFVNLPYQKAARTTRMALYDNGMGVPFIDLYNYVQKFIVKPEDLHKINTETTEDPKLKDYPPCVQGLLKTKLKKDMEEMMLCLTVLFYVKK